MDFAKFWNPGSLPNLNSISSHHVAKETFKTTGDFMHRVSPKKTKGKSSPRLQLLRDQSRKC
jgi:hypothetical protein